jgi:hypothetical protein
MTAGTLTLLILGVILAGLSPRPGTPRHKSPRPRSRLTPDQRLYSHF